MFSVQVTQEERGVVFALRGELDFESTVQLDEAGAGELARGRDGGLVVADCTALSFCDSSGINALLRLLRQLAVQERALRLVAVPNPVARLFSLTGLDRVFDVYATAGHALAASVSSHDRVSADVDGSTRTQERRSI
ncbi:STAS domain-containing protein [Streptomyces sp. NPDC056670]|uniref:STAS domain-containing protein n=1 Tax=Streptomyces sp. NPDC056670 TaxID=3345904 RepID=UPI00369EEF9B